MWCEETTICTFQNTLEIKFSRCTTAILEDMFENVIDGVFLHKKTEILEFLLQRVYGEAELNRLRCVYCKDSLKILQLFSQNTAGSFFLKVS